MRRRSAFTIVELMVALALIVLIMAVLSQAFAEGLGTFRQLKAVGDLQENLRSAVVPLRNDLLARHFDTERKVGDLPLTVGPTATSPRPTEGYFRIQAPPGKVPEGLDGDGIPSYRAVNHSLIFTIQSVGKRRENWDQGRVPPQLPNGASDPLQNNGPGEYAQAGLMLSQWEEVAWFLAPQGDDANGTPLYTLHRRKRLLTTNQNVYTDINVGPYGPVPSTEAPNFIEASFSVVGGALHFNSPAETALPAPLRGVMYPIGTGGENAGYQYDDLVIADVVSFEVQVLRATQVPGGWVTNNEFEDPETVFAPINPGDPPGIYDSATTPLPLLRIKAIKVTIRVWDYRTEQTRQITMIQDL